MAFQAALGSCGFGNSPVVARRKVRGPGRSLPLTSMSEFASEFLVNSIIHEKAVSSCPDLLPVTFWTWLYRSRHREGELDFLRFEYSTEKNFDAAFHFR